MSGIRVTTGPFGMMIRGMTGGESVPGREP